VSSQDNRSNYSGRRAAAPVGGGFDRNHSTGSAGVDGRRNPNFIVDDPMGLAGGGSASQLDKGYGQNYADQYQTYGGTPGGGPGYAYGNYGAAPQGGMQQDEGQINSMTTP